MRTIFRRSLPDVLRLNGKAYRLDLNAPHPILRKRGRHVEVHVLSRNLEGKTDLHGKPYQPSIFTFTLQQ